MKRPTPRTSNDSLTLNSIGLGVTVLLLFLYNPSVGLSQQQVDLLSLPSVSLRGDAVRFVKNEPAIRDGNKATSIKFDRDSKTLDLVYFFGAETVTLKEIEILTIGVVAKSAQIEILASNLSDSATYQSVFVEPLRRSGKLPQRVKFNPTGARWVMVRFIPAKEDATITVAELALRGNIGEPTSSYKFDESPASAIEVLAKLSNTVDVGISEEEASMFRDAKDGRFDETSFAEAALNASAIFEPAKRSRMLEQIQQLTSVAKSRIPSNLPTFKRAEMLLEFLHADAFRNGYIKEQTDVSTALEKQTFNCVSSATLYNIIGQEIGLDCRAIEVPDHAFSIVYDGTSHADVETTTGRGFNPARNKTAIDEFQRQTGFAYIPDKNRTKRRELGETGLIAITYYNHGVGFTKRKKYREALISYFKALNLDANNKSAVKNVLSVFSGWSHELAKAGDFEKAISVLNTGLELAPQDRNLLHNYDIVWRLRINELITSGNPKQAIKELKRPVGFETTRELKRLQSYVFIKLGESKIESKQWQASLDIADNGLETVDNEEAKQDIIKWKTNVVLRWSYLLIKEQQFAEAVDALETQLKFKSEYRIESQLGFAVQEWSRHIAATKGDDESLQLIVKLWKRFPKSSRVIAAANNFLTVTAKKHIDNKDYETALSVFATARESLPSNHQLNRNETATWSAMAKEAIESRDWKNAMEIYSKAYAVLPNERLIRQNIHYIVQEWGRDVAKISGIAAGEKVVSDQAKKFTKLHELKKMTGKIVSSELRRLVESEKFDEAELVLSKHKKSFLISSDLSKRATYVYHSHAKKHLVSKQWKDAVAIFEKGYQSFPNNRDMRTNLVFVWNSWAKEAMDKNDWSSATEIYEKAFVSLPGNTTIETNLRFCRGKLKDEK
ncbi:MAG: hypothetical protein AB8B55_02430 [Mariniblastus sp.]